MPRYPQHQFYVGTHLISWPMLGESHKLANVGNVEFYNLPVPISHQSSYVSQNTDSKSSLLGGKQIQHQSLD